MYDEYPEEKVIEDDSWLEDFLHDEYIENKMIEEMEKNNE